MERHSWEQYSDSYGTFREVCETPISSVFHTFYYYYIQGYVATCLRQTCQVSRITRESHGFWQFLKAHGRETQCSRIFVNLTECCDQGIHFFCTQTIL